MKTETLQMLQVLYAENPDFVWIADTAGVPIWKNTASGPLQTEEDFQAVLHLLNANVKGFQTFWHHTILYAAELQEYPTLECLILRVLAEPVLNRFVWEPFSSVLCQEMLAEQRASIFHISATVEQIYEEIATNDIGDLEEETIFSALNNAMHSCCQMLRRTNYETELKKYKDPAATALQPLDLSDVLNRFVRNCKEISGHRLSWSIQVETKVQILCQISRLYFSLLCLITQLLVPNQKVVQKLHLKTKIESRTVTIFISCIAAANQKDCIFPFFEPLHAGKIQEQHFVAVILHNFCRTYNAELKTKVHAGWQEYQLTLPQHTAANQEEQPLQATEPEEYKKSLSFLNQYQIMLCDITDYRFY